MAGSGWPERWDLLLRYRLIEVISLWEGRLTTNHLQDAFGIGRQQASRDINAYLSEKCPGALEYDKSLKGYKPTAAFTPRYTNGDAGEYLHLLNMQNGISDSISSLDIRLPNTAVIAPPARMIQPEVLRLVLRACRERSRLCIQYASMRHPRPAGRVIQPHTLVYNGYRWHVRAWCEKRDAFRDFVLSRIMGCPELLGPATVDDAKDVAWHTMVKLVIIADRRLSADQKRVVAADWGFTKGSLTITTRAALVTYYLQLLRLDVGGIARTPKEQQVELRNMPGLRQWLFEGSAA